MFPKHFLAAGFVLALWVPPAAAQTSGLTRDLSPEQIDVERVKPPQSDLRVEAWTDRTDYKPGEILNLFVKTNMDAHVWVVDVGTSGKVHILFPNKFQTSNKVLAHQVVQIPGADANWRIKVGGPPGQELIKVIATTKADAIIDPTKLAELGSIYQYRDTAQSLTRDLGAVFANPQGGISATLEKFIRILPQDSMAPPPAGPAPRHAAATPAPPAPRVAGTNVKTEDLYRLGEAAFYGDGGAPNYRRALQFFADAAEGGHVGAMFFIGRIHESGQDVDASPAHAVTWYRKAADLGNTQAMVRLAMLHANKDGPHRDLSESARWLKRAATQGDGMAMIHLARMHDEGLGVNRSPRDAAKYLLSALKTGAWTVIDQATKFSEDTRRELQTQLQQAGHYRGPIEGRMGAETRAAMVEWARAG